MSLWLGQAVVTDTGAGGYRLAAASPSVTPEDREHLAVAPMISDFLHLEQPARVYWSFHLLPSGARAFSRRQALGTRRGSFNRIVVHTLVVPDEVLDSLAWEPRLLPNCTFRQLGGGASFGYEQVVAWADAEALERPDLAIEPPADAAGRRLQLIAGRLRFLAGEMGGDPLQGALAEAISALEQELSFLAPQGNEPEQLLALAWALLPRADRRQIGWTTHLAPGMGPFFRLANAPSPAEARTAERDPGRWLRSGEARPKVGGEALARAAVEGRWGEIARDWYEGEREPALCLAEGGARLERWILHVAEGGAPPAGFASLSELLRHLERRKITAASAGDPWQSAGSLLDHAASALIAESGGPPEAALVEQASHQLSGRLDERTLEPALREVAEHDREGERLVVALDLALRTDPTDRHFVRRFEAAAGPAEASGAESLLGRLADRFLVPRLAAHAALANELGEKRLDRFLAALPAYRPEALAAALDRFLDPLHDRALGQLARLARADGATARKVAAAVATGAYPAAVRDRPALAGFTQALADAGSPAEHWLAFAVREAMVLDREGTEEGRLPFVARLERLRVSPEVAAGFAVDFTKALDRLDRPGAALRALGRALAPGLAVQAQEIVAACARLSRLEDEAFAAWGETLAAVALAFDKGNRRQEASTIRRNWWIDLARRPLGPIGPSALGMLAGLQGRDAGAVAAVWLPHLRELESHPGGATLAQKIRAMAEGDPEHWRELEITDLKNQVEGGHMELEEAVVAVEALAREARAPAGFLDQALVHHFLPRNDTERLLLLLPLAVSPRLLPTTRKLLGDKWLSGLRQAERDGRLPWAVPIDRLPLLTRRRDLLLTAARSWGESWNQTPVDAVAFLEAVLEHGLLDAAGVFLAAAERRKGFLSRYLPAQRRYDLIARLAAAAKEPCRGAGLHRLRPSLAAFETKLPEGDVR